MIGFYCFTEFLEDFKKEPVRPNHRKNQAGNAYHQVKVPEVVFALSVKGNTFQHQVEPKSEKKRKTQGNECEKGLSAGLVNC